MTIITKKELKNIVYPVIISSEIENDRKKFDTMIYNLPKGIKHFLPMTEVPRTGAVANYIEKNFTSNIRKKTECICNWSTIEDQPERVCYCKLICTADFVKNSKEYGLLVEWKVITKEGKNKTCFDHDYVKYSQLAD